MVEPNRHRETDSLPGETKPSSIFLEDDDSPAAADDTGGPTASRLFWKNVKISADNYAAFQSDRAQPLLLEMWPNRPRSAASQDQISCCEPFAMCVFASVALIPVGYAGLVSRLQSLCIIGDADDFYSCSKQPTTPWYIVAAYFVLPMLCMMMFCFASRRALQEPVYDVLSSEEDGITLASITTKQKTTEGEVISVEKIPVTTSAEIV